MGDGIDDLDSPQTIEVFLILKRNIDSCSGIHPARIGWLSLFFVALLLGTAFFGCEAKSERRESVEAKVDNSQAKETADQANGRKPSEFELQEIEQLDSPFTKETVLELNTIVGRSLAAIDAFDTARKVQNDETAIANQLDKFKKLSKQASDAKVDMDAAKERLLKSGEKYNDEIFQAMVRFVDEVDKEIRDEISTLSEKK